MSRSLQTIKNMAFAVISFLLCGMLAFAICGCTAKKSDETIIRESVAEVLGDFRSVDSDMAKRFISEMDIQELGNVGLSAMDFMKAYTDGFTYEISDIRIDGKSAEADIVVFVKSFSEFEKRFASEVETLSRKYVIRNYSSDSSDASSQLSISSISPSASGSSSMAEGASDPSSARIRVTAEEMDSMFARTVVNCMKDTPVRETDSVTVRFTNVDNTWRPSPTAMDDLMTAMMSN